MLSFIFHLFKVLYFVCFAYVIFYISVCEFVLSLKDTENTFETYNTYRHKLSKTDTKTDELTSRKTDSQKDVFRDTITKQNRF